MTRLGELHIEQARRQALRLVSYATAVYPYEWKTHIEESCSLELLEFAFHARRVNDIFAFNDQNFGSADKLIVKLSEGDPGGWQKCYTHALNALHHSVEFKFGWAHADHRKVYEASEANLIPTYVKVTTDKFPCATLSLYGIANCFLTGAIARIKQQHPDCRF
jgi:hypothetical protein